MNELEKNNINTFIVQNRTKLDEALVSLRLMKEVDEFLDENEISQRELSEFLGYSEAFVSQLMSGTKKFNASFINRLEKSFNVIVKFNIVHKDKGNYITSFYNNSIVVDFNSNEMNPTNLVYSISVDDEQAYNPFLEQ